MVVQHNIQAINANRQLNVVTGQQAKSTEKLSSGFKINRAADDAAGLSISEKMRRQIRGLDRASTNASDGVSAMQTAEGALNEVHDMLQRMNELANQASNGTNSQTDREAIQNEIDALTTEIDRVSETTKFNETMLLKGGDGKKDVTLVAHDAGLKGNLVDNKDKTAAFSADLTAGEKVNIGGKEYTLKADDGKLSTDAAKIAEGVQDLKVKDAIFVENGTAHSAFQVEDNLAVAAGNKNSGIFDATVSFSDTAQIGGTAGDKVAINYMDDEGIEQTYEMKFDSGKWQKVTGYNSKTGEENLGGIDLYNGTSPAGEVSDEELTNVLRTATKIVATQAGTGETITFGDKDVIEKELADTQVGSKIFMSETPGQNTTSKIAATYTAFQTARSADGKFDVATTNAGGLGEAKTVKETSDVNVGDDNSITIHDAKKLMAQELKAANEIGVDNKDDVSAQFRKSGSDIANELALNNGDNVTIKKADQNGIDQSTTYNIKNDLKNVGTSFANLGLATASNGRITIKSSDGTVTELKNTTTATEWQRVDDDSTLTDSDIKELVKNAVAIDFQTDSTQPEGGGNTVTRWRTAEGMREDISKLDNGNKVKVTNGTSSTYDTGDIEVKNDAAATQNFDMKIGTVEVDKALSFNLHVGADADLNNKIGVDIETMNSKYLGIKGLDVVGKDKDGNNINDGGKAATYAIDAIENAIQKVNDQRSALGAVQNRLEHTINNLDNVVENTTAAESRIRDTDIADEMVNYSKNNILAQAGQSMLAQANQSTQGALSLLG